MDKDFLVFWYDGNGNRATVIAIKHPPHDEPRGSVLEELLIEGIVEAESISKDDVLLSGAVELGLSAWSPGACRELVTGEGRVGSVECTATGWRVHL